MSLITDIKARVDIVDVVSQYVHLQKTGHDFKANCPFHAEKGPSFFVYPDRQTWRCYGTCGIGGDVFSFVAKIENTDFRGALQILAQRAGISLTPKREETEEEKRLKRLREANELAAQFYHRNLLELPSASSARAYLERRGLILKTIQDFQLGLSLEAWDGLHQYLPAKGFTNQELLDAGLIVETERGIRDCFRHRIMFPICNEDGWVVGFGGRVLDNTEPKYLNSPQTPLFDKSGMLYGIDKAKTSIRRLNQAIVMEGYMDVIVAHQCGVTNAVASMGTALTERQIRILKRYSKNLALALDADVAGSEAMLRGVQVAEQAFDHKVMPVPTWQGLVRYQDILDGEVRIILLPLAKDPDEVMLADMQQWQRLATEAVPTLDFLFQSVAAKLDLSQPRSKSEAADRLLPVIAEMQDKVQQAHYLQRLAHLIQVDQRVLQQSLPRVKMAPRRGRQEAKTEPPPRSLTKARDLVEEHCLSLLLQHPSLRQEGLKLDAQSFEYSENQQIFLAWLQEPDPALLQEKVDPALRDHLEILSTAFLPPMDSQEALSNWAYAVLRLEEQRLRSLQERMRFLTSELEKELKPADMAQTAYSWWRNRAAAGQVSEKLIQLVEERQQLSTRLRQLLIEQRSTLRQHVRTPREN